MNRKQQEKLYKKHYSNMLKICMRYATNLDEAKDLLHDGFIKVFTKKTPKSITGGWIYKIMVNTCIDNIRKRIYTIELNEQTIYTELKSDDHPIVTNASIDKCFDALQLLTPHQRAIFNMYVIDKFRHQEIADIFNITVGASKSQLSRAKQSIRKTLNYEYNK